MWQDFVAMSMVITLVSLGYVYRGVRTCSQGDPPHAHEWSNKTGLHLRRSCVRCGEACPG